MNTGKLIGALLSLASLGAVLFAIDARYEHVEAAEKQITALKTDIEQIRLSNELSTQRARLSFLANKKDLTPDEKLEADFARSQVALLQQQLASLQR